MALRVIFEYDPEPDISYLEQWDTPEKYAEAPVMDGERQVPYEEYLTYWGNPERHVFIQADVEEECECCKSWVRKASLGGIDFMDDDRDWTTGTFSQEDIAAGKVKGYLAEVAAELFDEASNA